jgi:hypothetical protein
MTNDLLTKATALLEARERATQGELVYDPKRDTHDCAVYVKGSVEEYGYISPDNGGVIGLSEWLWLEEPDGHFFTLAANNAAEIVTGYQDLVRRMADKLEAIQKITYDCIPVMGPLRW